MQRAAQTAMSNNAHMRTAREMVLKEVEAMLDELGMKASTLARAADVATSTLTRFLSNPDAPLLSTSTLMKLRATRERLLSARAAPLNLDHLTKNAKKRALIADLLAMPDDQFVAVENAIKSAPKARAALRKSNDAA